MSRFSRWFKKATGVPETDLRKLPFVGDRISAVTEAAALEFVNALDAQQFDLLRRAVNVRAYREDHLKKASER